MDRSMVFSILKCEFGWSGIIPDGLRMVDIQKRIDQHTSSSCCADEIAVILVDHGAVFCGRIDGKQNHRRVVNGSVLR